MLKTFYEKHQDTIIDIMMFISMITLFPGLSGLILQIISTNHIDIYIIINAIIVVLGMVLGLITYKMIKKAYSEEGS